MFARLQVHVYVLREKHRTAYLRVICVYMCVCVCDCGGLRRVYWHAPRTC
jgi:hypothetical protein